jgi:DDE superfamily endonuclease
VNVATLPLLWQSVLASLASWLHQRSAWRLAVVLLGLLFAQGRRRTVTSWLRAAQVQHDFADFYYFLGALGRTGPGPAASLLRHLLRHLPQGATLRFVLDDTPTKRYGRHVQGAGIHHNPSPGPADAPYLYGHLWVTLAVVVTHPQGGPSGWPIRALLYVRKKDLPKIPRRKGWVFRSKLELAAELITWAAGLVRGQVPAIEVLVDGAYAKKPFLKAAAAAGVSVISRLRRDAALRSLPRPKPAGRRGPQATYGDQALRLALRAGQTRGWQTIRVWQYGEERVKQVKTFLATWRPAGGVIRVVLVQEPTGGLAWFSTAPELTAEQIVAGAAQRMVIEQDFHDLKEVEGLGQPQLRDIDANVGAVQATLWEFTLVELWAWEQPPEALGDRRASPWDDPRRRPSHADKRKALQRWCLRQEYLGVWHDQPLTPQMQEFIERLLERAA